MKHILKNNGLDPILKTILKKMDNRTVLAFGSVNKAAHAAIKKFRPDVHQLTTIIKKGCGPEGDENPASEFEYCYSQRCIRIAAEALLTGYEHEASIVLSAQVDWMKNGEKRQNVSWFTIVYILMMTKNTNSLEKIVIFIVPTWEQEIFSNLIFV